ncbi:MAG: pentapeptide repeat-containing protein [Crocosphaera sp.]
MFQSQEAIDLNQRYEKGQRNFQGFQLRRADLRGLNLSHGDFRGVDLSYANLREVNFTGADLRDAYFNEADLTGVNFTGANLSKASLIKVYLIKATCYQTDFSGAYLTGAYLTKSKFQEAKFHGAYLNGTKLSGAELAASYYDENTRFDTSFNPETALMKREESKKKNLDQGRNPLEIKHKQAVKTETITLEKVLEIFNHLTAISHRYLGKTMTQKYWESSRPIFEWLQGFEMTKSTEIRFNGELETVLSPTKVQWLQAWVKTFIKNCSQIVQHYPKMLDYQLVKTLIAVELTQTRESNSFENTSNVTAEKTNPIELISA